MNEKKKKKEEKDERESFSHPHCSPVSPPGMDAETEWT